MELLLIILLSIIGIVSLTGIFFYRDKIKSWFKKHWKQVMVAGVAGSISTGGLLLYDFDPPAADSGWWSDTTWDYSKKITIDHTKVDTTLTNFPILVHIIGDTDLGSHAQDDGDDILFTMDGDNETKLNHEIEYYNNDSGTVAADIWVNVTSLSSSADTVIWMYYGNAVAANQENVAGVWNSNYVLVLHLNETRSTDAGHYKDSTSYDNDGTLTDADSGVSRVSGMVAGCIDFDGDNPDHIAVPDDTELDITDSYTIEYWANLDTITGWKSVTGKWNTAAEKYHMYTGFYNNNLFFKQQCDGVDFVALGNDGLSTATWYYSVFQLDKTATDIRVYHNKTLDTTTNTGSYTSAQVTDDELWIGHPQAFAEPYDGEIDEFRLSNVAWNTSWLSATFNTMADNSNFITLGSEQRANNAPTVDYKTPVNGTTGVAINGGVTCYAYTNDTDGDPLDITWATNESGSWVNKYTNTSEPANGTESYTFTDFDTAGTTYWWKVYVDDGTVNISEIYHFTTIPYNTTIRTSGVDYFVWLGANQSAWHVKDAIGATFNEAGETISILNNIGHWDNYTGAGGGNNFSIHTFDVVKIVLDDGAGTLTFNMTPNSNIDYDAARTVTLTKVGNGYNFTGWTNSSSTTLSAENTTLSLTAGYFIALWNETNYNWDYWISGWYEIDKNILQYDVVMTKIATTKSNWQVG